MQSEEVKPSWSFSYIGLVIVVSIPNLIIGGILGYFLKYIFDPSDRRILTVTETQTENLLTLDQKVYDEIITSYTLRNTPSETIKSYFRYSATIRNDGDVGVEKLKVVVQVQRFRCYPSQVTFNNYGAPGYSSRHYLTAEQEDCGNKQR